MVSVGASGRLAFLRWFNHWTNMDINHCLLHFVSSFFLKYFRDDGICIILNFHLSTQIKCSGKTPKATTIRVGSTSHLTGGSVVHVKRIIQNEKYVATDYDYDFGLIELTDKLVFNKSIQSIALPSPNESLTDGTNCTVYSWGK